jgi:hypothetical protein
MFRGRGCRIVENRLLSLNLLLSMRLTRLCRDVASVTYITGKVFHLYIRARMELSKLERPIGTVMSVRNYVAVIR